MRFTFRPVLTVAALAGLAVLIGLGTWQVQRLEWKRDLITKVEARTTAEPIEFAAAYQRWLDGEDMEYTPVRVALTLDHDREFHVFGSWEGAPGWYIFVPSYFRESTPDQAGPDTVVYVNRGFAPHTFKSIASRTNSVTSNQLDDQISITGLLRTPQPPSGLAGYFTPENNAEKNEWYVRDPQVFAKTADLNALPVWIDSFGTESVAQWPKGGTTRLQFNNRHLEYALTWFGLALTLIAVYVAFSLKRE